MDVTVRDLLRMRPVSEASYIGKPGMVRQLINPHAERTHRSVSRREAGEIL